MNAISDLEHVRHVVADEDDRQAALLHVTDQLQHPVSFLDPDTSLVMQDVRDSEAAEGAASELLARPDSPTALFTARNTITIGAIRALRHARLQQQVALVGFDEVPLADLLDPSVSVIAQDITAIGQLAARLLFQRLAGDDSPYREHLIPTRLICRGSGEITPP